MEGGRHIQALQLVNIVNDGNPMGTYRLYAVENLS